MMGCASAMVFSRFLVVRGLSRYRCACACTSRCRCTSLRTAGLFYFREAWPKVSWNGTPRKFHGKNGARSLDKGQHDHAQDVIVRMLVFVELAHSRGQRTKHSIAQKNAQKGSNQRGGNFV